jgi:hypothetical protein
VEVYHELAAHRALAALPVEDRFYEVGSVAGIEATEKYLAGGSRA